MLPKTSKPGWARTGSAILAMLVAAALAPAPAGAEPAPAVQVKITAYGEYRAVPHKDVEAAPDTAAGLVGLMNGNPPLIAHTAEIVAAEGVSFGMLVSVPGLPADRTLPVTIRLDHPPITAPDGRVWRTQTSEGTLTPEPRFKGFCFDHAWELASGEWTYTLLHEGRPIASQRFTLTVDPAKKVEARCSPELAVS